MNRIKCKIWDKQKKKFVGCFKENIRYILDTGELFINGTNFTDGFILCQYIGTKDKNHVEIYEDSIVKVGLFAQGEGVTEAIGVVKYQDFEYVVETDRDDWPVASWSCVTDAEVIGNIHEHPELVKEIYHE